MRPLKHIRHALMEIRDILMARIILRRNRSRRPFHSQTDRYDGFHVLLLLGPVAIELHRNRPYPLD